MPRTKDQQSVIDTKQINMIVSAGAGSGKTSTLTDRVIDIIKNGLSIKNLLVLTFTNAASQEMKDRIRTAIIEVGLTDELANLDSSYICTFDSFALSIVKKYYYILGLDKHIDICESSLIDVVSKKIARLVLDEEYQNTNKELERIAKEFLIKDDEMFLKTILSANIELDRIVDKEKYIDNYYINFSNKDKIEELKSIYLETLKDKLNEVIDNMTLVYHESDELVGDKILVILEQLKNVNTYEDIYDVIFNMKFPRKNKNCSEDYDAVRKKLSESIKTYKTLLSYPTLDEFEDEYMDMLRNSYVLMNLIDKFNKKLNDYKQKNKLYTFNDIAKMIIQLLETNEEVRNELKSQFKEIMIDEYQDTSDIQERLINLLSSNNVCVVGDVKQSIYRFRNANPIIFKEKYDTYGKIENTKKIDLLENFRSREEVVEDVNFLFSDLMRDKAGGAKYKEEHKMVFGNHSYDKYKAKQDYHLEVLDYFKIKEEYGSIYTNAEIEAFVIANDIKQKIKNKYQIYNFKKKDEGLRDAKYSDFCILMPVTTSFDVYKRIFEYMGIPLTILKNESLVNGSEILTLKNLCLFIKSIYTKEFDENSIDTKHQFLSIARSFLVEESDQNCFDIINEKRISETEVYAKAAKIANKLDVISITEFIDMIIEEFGFVFNYNKKDGIKKMLVESEYLHQLSNVLAKANVDIEGFVDYLNDVIDNKIKIEVASNDYNPELNAVKMMGIHKSKGLEFQVCYLASNYSGYNEMDIKERFIFNKDLGLISPLFKHGVKNTFMKTIFTHISKNEDRAEKIRLFYVGATRAKEKLIIVDSIDEDKLCEGFVNDYAILKANSFSKLLHGIYYKMADRIKTLNASDVKLTKDYFNTKKDKELSEKYNEIEVNEYQESIIIEEEKHFSKRTYKLIDKDAVLRMEFGNVIHETLEALNFKDEKLMDNIDSLSLNAYYKNKIKKFFENEILKDLKEAKIYKEYKFYSDELDAMGIIDLMLEYENRIDIIDYKLKNINDEAYFRQLNLYKTYIESISDKTVNIYLYSIIDENLLKLV